ncbi:TPA: hypothetical protein HA235_00645 [Candidatus Woesearchaeota archaeon]|nr:hypothetical protein [Candidatus Woesearchaeota archaeon]HIH31192.1 hypothetical protein [Candidatus Woesearchaeota archaeon]HIH55541.1 hypothetical protein [Candidatus Woesearchaeota archaeon]HIJ01838.1 hypothetical protein [Candidatus Woesearchaeota archaeon]HIJ13131.1 hypothetical protein [Candidatus Woesearchaeota archaeon]
MNSFNEQKLKKIAKPYMEKARSGDWKHALRVVKWVKILGKNRKDLPFLITAAYIHDIGWSGVAPKGKLDFDHMLKLEKKANNNSRRLTLIVLRKIKFSNSEMKTVDRLIAAADKHMSRKKDEEIIVDADNLSKLCLAHIKEKYEPESYGKLIKIWENDLAKRIKTEYGKKIYPRLLKELKEKIGGIR